MRPKPFRCHGRARAGAIPVAWRWVIGFAGWLIVACSATAQPLATNALPSPAELIAQLETRLSEARADLGAMSANSATSTNLPPGANAAEAEEYRLMAEALVRNYQEHLYLASRLESGWQRQREAEQQAKTWTGFAQPGPYSILLIDELGDTVQSFTAKLTAAETTGKVLADLSGDAEDNLKRSDERLRLLTEQLETAKDPARVVRLSWQRRLEQLRNRQAAAVAALNETRRRRLDTELAEYRPGLALARRQLAVARRHARFSQADLDQVLAGLSLDQREAERELPEAERDYRDRQRDLAATREELRQALQTAAQTEADPAVEARVRNLQASVELRAVQADTSAARLVVVRQVADAGFLERGLWQMRYATFGTSDLDSLRQAYRRLEELGRLIHSAKPHFVQQVELAANLSAEQRNRLQSRAESEPQLATARELLEAYRQQEELAHRALRRIEKLERLARRWKESLDDHREHLPLTARARDLFGGFRSFAAKFWNFELFVAEDTITVDGQKITGRRSVTVGKVLMAVLILAVGYGLAVWTSRLVERLAVRRFKFEANQAKLLRQWIQVVFVLALVVFSLVSVKIPLTVFAFLGGALAIGVGFGTQNLLKNFISGIIILFERPFRVGDLLDVGGQRGVVSSVGIRSSVLRLFDGTETLIPNSALLENNLTNWTYTDQKVRFTVAVGVAYGSDTRRVSRLLAETVERHGLVEKDPTPQVLFQGFGDSALEFELRYWVNVLLHNAAQVSSDLRHMIAGAFAEHGIVMAFPQRDLHLDTARPLQIQMLPPEPPPPPAAAADDPSRTPPPGP